jgi:UDP-N-acetylmuramate: L-alanyl-gamma-D-glutamyl-meso-diaminopimelate ligase
MKAQLPWALEGADHSYCFSGGIDWDAAEALRPLGSRASVFADIQRLVQRIVADARPGDQWLCMSNGGFQDIHQRLLTALTTEVSHLR